MPVVPVYQQKVQEQALPRARQSADAPIEAFGGGPSAQGVQRAAENLGNVVSDFAVKEKAYIDDIQVTEADTKLAQKQTDIQIGISKLQGRNANGAREYATAEMNKAIEEYSGGLTGGGSLAFKKVAANRAEGLYSFSEKHTAAENQKADRGVLVDRLKVLNAKATSNALDNEDDFESALNQDLKDVNDGAKALAKFEGIPERSADGTNNPSYQQLVNGALSTVHRDVIDARINAGAIDKAFVYFKNRKDMMTADDMKYAEKRVEDALVVVDANKIFRDGLKARLPGGGINQKDIFKAIDEKEGISPDRKMRIATMVKGLISQENIRDHQVKLDTDGAFKEWAANEKKRGASLSQIVANIPPHLYYSEADKINKQQWAGKIFNPVAKSQAPEFYELKERIQKGGGSLEEIDDVDKKFNLNDAQKYQLRKEFNFVQTKAVNVDRNNAMDSIKNEVKARFKKDNLTAKEIIDQVENESLGKTGVETRAIFDKKMKDVVIEPGYIWDTKVPQWKIDRQKNKAKFQGAQPTDAETKAAADWLRKSGFKVNEQAIQKRINETKAVK